MDDSWACSAAYAYVLHLDPASRAWEYLRRNPRYQRDWAHYRRSASQRVAGRWGLAALVDPRLDARQVSPVWVIDEPPPVTLVRDEMVHERKRSEAGALFSLWSLVSRARMFQDGGGLRLVVHSPAGPVQLQLGGQLREGDRFAYQIPATAVDRATWTALAGFRALMPISRGAGATLSERPDRAALFHARALQVLDGLAARTSQRELAIAIFGSATVARGWQPDGALRAQLRYLVRRARALMTGEYRSLIGTGQVDSPFSRKSERGGSSGSREV